MKKLQLHSEFVYFLGIILIAISVAMSIVSNFGISVLSCPAYLIHLKVGFSMTIGEYATQALLLVIFCLIMREVHFLYLATFVTTLIYGVFLKLFQLIPFLAEGVELHIAVRIIFMILSLLLIALAIALFSRTYLYPQIYDFFIIAIPKKYHINQGLFKLINDLSFLAVSIILSLIFFQKIVGIGIGSVIFAVLTGPTVNLMNKLLDKTVEVKPAFNRLELLFVGDNHEGQSNENTQDN